MLNTENGCDVILTSSTHCCNCLKLNRRLKDALKNSQNSFRSTHADFSNLATKVLQLTPRKLARWQTLQLRLEKKKIEKDIKTKEKIRYHARNGTQVEC